MCITFEVGVCTSGDDGVGGEKGGKVGLYKVGGKGVYVCRWGVGGGGGGFSIQCTRVRYMYA